MKNIPTSDLTENTAARFDIPAMAEYYKTHTLVETARHFATSYNVLRSLFLDNGIAIRKQGPYYDNGLADNDRAEIWAKRHFEDGETLQAIGTDYGVTRERVRQVVLKYKSILGIADRDDLVKKQNIESISRYASEGMSVTEIAEKISLSPVNVSKLAKKNNIVIPRKKKMRRDDIMETANQVAEMYQNDVAPRDIKLKLGLSCTERVYYLLNVAGVTERHKTIQKQTVE
jgi:predicted DNA-binding protein YlxM (UPF0122 family)